MGDTLPLSGAALASAESEVAQSAVSVTLLAANGGRKGATIVNNTSAALYILLGDGASLAKYSAPLAMGGYYEVPFGYAGIITGIWGGAGSGNALVTELV